MSAPHTFLTLLIGGCFGALLLRTGGPDGFLAWVIIMFVLVLVSGAYELGKKS